MTVREGGKEGGKEGGPEPEEEVGLPGPSAIFQGRTDPRTMMSLTAEVPALLGGPGAGHSLVPVVG